MASVLALISKAVFEKLPFANVGDVVPLDRYTSKHAAFDKLGPGDSLVLVTVRPDGPILVAVIDEPKREGEALVGKTNVIPIADLTGVIGALSLADGKGITAPLAKLGMSLQTPRVLADEDVALLRGALPKRSAPRPAVQMKVAPRTAIAYAKLRGGKPSPRAKQLVEDVYQSPGDRALRGILADQLLEDQHVWGELISLQMTDPKKHAERIGAIIQQHAREIVGEIVNVATREDLEIEDGFLVAVRCGKSKSFTKAADRMKAAKAPQWATVRTVTLTSEMPGTFVEALLANPAASNLTTIRDGAFDRQRKILARATPRDPWQLLDATYGRAVLMAMPANELARIPPPKTSALQATLEAARAKRAKKKR